MYDSVAERSCCCVWGYGTTLDRGPPFSKPKEHKKTAYTIKYSWCQIICSLHKLDCSAMLIHLSMILFLLFSVYNQIFTMFNILFAIHYYLFILLFCFKINYSFVLVKYLFPLVETNYLVLKISFQISCRYWQVWSHFEDFVIRNTMVQ